MTGTILLKYFADICICCAVIGALPKLFPHDFMLLIPALVCTAGVGTAAVFEVHSKPWLRYVALVFPLASLLQADSLMEYLILAPMVLYAVMIILRGSFFAEYYSFREQFIRVGTALGVFAVLILFLGYLEEQMNPGKTVYDLPSLFLYCLLYAFTGVFLLRQLRLGADSQPRDRLWNNVFMVIVLIVIILVTVGLVMAHEVLLDCLSLPLVLFAFVLDLIVSLISWVMRLIRIIPQAQPVETYEQVLTESAETVTLPTGGQWATEQVVQNENGFPWWLAVLVLVSLCVALILLLRNLNKNTDSFFREELVYDLEKKTPASRRHSRSNRGKIRKLYRTYLKIVRKRGLELRSDQTSQDILLSSQERVDQTSAAWLRQLYLKARYDETAEITDQDVADAKTALSRLQTHQ